MRVSNLSSEGQQEEVMPHISLQQPHVDNSFFFLVYTQCASGGTQPGFIREFGPLVESLAFPARTGYWPGVQHERWAIPPWRGSLMSYTNFNYLEKRSGHHCGQVSESMCPMCSGGIKKVSGDLECITKRLENYAENIVPLYTSVVCTGLEQCLHLLSPSLKMYRKNRRASEMGWLIKGIDYFHVRKD